MNAAIYALSFILGVGICVWIEGISDGPQPRDAVGAYLARTKSAEPSWMFYLLVPVAMYVVRSLLSHAWLKVARARIPWWQPLNDRKP